MLFKNFISRLLYIFKKTMENEMNNSNHQLLNYPSIKQQTVDSSPRHQKDYSRKQNHGVVDIQEIKKAIEFAQNNIKMREQGEHMVIFWGYTGTGKSTTIIILNGQKVYGYDKYGIPILVNKINQQEQKQIKQRLKQGQVVIFIEKNVQSGTVYPSSLPMKISQKQEKVIMWDTPGFGDTKGITQALINTYFIHRLFNLQQKVKLVLTINFNDLIIDQKGDKLKRIIKTISEALRKFKNYEESMVILITKATQTASVEGVVNLFKQNMRLNYINQDQQIKKFFEIVCERKIPILVIKRPKIKQQDTKQKPREVTDDYIEFTQEFYKTVVNLRAAIVPNLKAPGMSQQEVIKCVNFGKQVKKKIMQLTSEMIKNLQRYIQNQYLQINFGDNLQKNKNSLNISDKMKEFIKTFQNITTNKCHTKIQFHQNFQNLADLFQRPNIKFQCESKDKNLTCIPMRTLRNEIIIIDFISSINIPDESVQYEKVMGQFFLVFIKKLPDLKALVQRLEIQALHLYQAHIQNKFDHQLNLWVSQQLFQEWNQNIKSFPSLYLKMISSKHKGLVDCIESMKQIEGEAEFECTKYLQPLLCLINYNQQLRNFNFDEIKFIEEKLKKKLQIHLKELQKYLDFNKWTKQQLSGIKIIVKQKTVLKEKENQIRKLQNDAMCDIADYEVQKQNIEAHSRRQIQNLKQKVQKIEKEKSQLSKQKQQLWKKLNQATEQNSLKEKRISNLLVQIERQKECPCTIM